MKLIVGLGNPGPKYEKNRHNVGFMSIDEIAGRHGFPPWRKRFSSETSEGQIDGARVLLMKPQTYMNESGRAVGEAVRFLKIPLDDVIVIYDEIDLAPGKLKAKTGGGNAGHNGLRSISAHIGNEYVRIRIGVGHPGRKDAVAGYVLHDFSRADQDWLIPLLDEISRAAGYLASGQPDRFLSEVNRALAPPGRNAANNRREGGPPQAGGVAEAAQRPRASASQQANRPGEKQSRKQLGSALADNLKKWLDRKD